MLNNAESNAKKPLEPLTPRQQELIRILQGFSPDRRYTLRIICRGREPWDVEEIVEHRKIDDGTRD